jgi:CheY-like chemotaxis protein
MSGESILVVDDNPINLKLLRVLLCGEGYDVQTAIDAEEAASMLQVLRPQLILMDLQLPGMDGYELTRRLKADMQTRGIVILAVTSYAMKGDEQRALDAGCDGYISKPVDTAALPEIVASHLHRNVRNSA